jgi:hypothetical protein
MEKKQKKIAALMQGNTMPFNVEYIVRAWDQTREGLATKMAAIKNAINGMNGAQYLACALPTTTRKLFFQSWPGCPWGRYHHRKLYAETRYLADVLPFSAAFTGHLAQAEALYEGSQRNLSVTTFSGSGGNARTARRLLGMSGAGKSGPSATCSRRPKRSTITPSLSRKDSRMKSTRAQSNLTRVRSSSSRTAT